MHSLFVAILAVSLLSGALRRLYDEFMVHAHTFECFSLMRTCRLPAGASAGITASKVTVQVSPDNIVSDTDTYTLETVVCLQPALSYFCNLIHVAKADPKVALLYDPATVATVFAPTDRVRRAPHGPLSPIIPTIHTGFSGFSAALLMD